jgi:hypothetical protein
MPGLYVVIEPAGNRGIGDAAALAYLPHVHAAPAQIQDE